MVVVVAADDSVFTNVPPELRTATAARRRQALKILLDRLRHGPAITADALEPTNVEAIASAARQGLQEPWSISQQADPRLPRRSLLMLPGERRLGFAGRS
jgi:hypothetical protein